MPYIHLLSHILRRYCVLHGELIMYQEQLRGFFCYYVYKEKVHKKDKKWWQIQQIQ